MNEKKRKKLFGVFNIVDILLILIVLLGAVIGWKLLAGKGQAEQAAGKVYSYVVMGPEVLDETAEFPFIWGLCRISAQSLIRKLFMMSRKKRSVKSLWRVTARFI